jgi:DNA processing protein
VGIDTAAHDGALNADGRTALVTATGIDVCYPPRHDVLFDRVAERGCVLTELLPGTPPRRDFFPTRNRVLVGLAQALVVVEGRPRSGTHSSVRHMQKLRRPIFAWTGARGIRAELNHEVLDHGGRPLEKPHAAAVLGEVLKTPDLDYPYSSPAQ